MQIFLEFDTSGDAVLDLQVLHPPLPSGAPPPPVGCLCPSPSGHLPKQEFRVALDVMGCTLPAEKLRQVFEFFDTDGNMLLDAMEFCQVRLASTSHLPPHASRRTSPHRLPLQLPPNDLLYPTIYRHQPTNPPPTLTLIRSSSPACPRTRSSASCTTPAWTTSSPWRRRPRRPRTIPAVGASSRWTTTTSMPWRVGTWPTPSRLGATRPPPPTDRQSWRYRRRGWPTWRRTSRTRCARASCSGNAPGNAPRYAAYHALELAPHTIRFACHACCSGLVPICDAHVPTPRPATPRSRTLPHSRCDQDAVLSELKRANSSFEIVEDIAGRPRASTLHASSLRLSTAARQSQLSAIKRASSTSCGAWGEDDEARGGSGGSGGSSSAGESRSRSGRIALRHGHGSAKRQGSHSTRSTKLRGLSSGACAFGRVQSSSNTSSTNDALQSGQVHLGTSGLHEDSPASSRLSHMSSGLREDGPCHRCSDGRWHRLGPSHAVAAAERWAALPAAHAHAKMRRHATPRLGFSRVSRHAGRRREGAPWGPTGRGPTPTAAAPIRAREAANAPARAAAVPRCASRAGNVDSVARFALAARRSTEAPWGVGVVALALWCHDGRGSVAARRLHSTAQHRTAPHSTAQHRTAPHSTARLHVLLSAPLPPPCCRDTQAQLGRRVALLLDRSRRSARTQHEQRRRRAAHHSSVGGRWGWGWGCHPYGGAVVVSDCGGRSSAARLAWRGHRDRAHGRRPHACRL